MAHKVLAGPGSTAPRSPAPATIKSSFQAKEAWLGRALVAPALFVILGMVAYPFVDAIRISFTDRMIGMGPGRYVGLKNYIYILTWPEFGQMVARTVLFTLAATFIKTCVGLIIASSLNQEFKGRNILRGVFMLPWILPTYIIVLVWRWIFDGQTGVLNQILVSWGIIDSNIPWLAIPPLAIGCLIFVLVWKGYPFYALTFLAGMQAISKELYDAAKVDGAGRIGRFIHVTLPGIRNVMVVVLLLSTIWTMNQFEIPFLLTGGGPSNKTEVFTLLTYNLAMNNFRLGEGAAVPILILPILVMLILVVSSYMEKEVAE